MMDLSVLVFFFAIVTGLFYFLPSIIAGRRDHPNKLSIFILNLFFGWTLVGWVGALIWALGAIDKLAVPVVVMGHAYIADGKVCPRCAEVVKGAANVCRFCGHEFSEITNIPEN